MKHLFFLFALGLLLLEAACGSKGAAKSRPSLERSVYAVFYPAAYFTERIAEGRVHVVCPVPEGQDPIFYIPPRRVIQRYRHAALIIENGAAYAKWVKAAALPRSRVVQTAAPFSKSFITFKTVTHSHGPKGKHTHRGIDGHTWMDPVQAEVQAGVIEEALGKAFPEQRQVFQQGLAALRADLEDLLGRLKKIGLQKKGIRLVATHPAYNYLARRLGWKVLNIAVDPESPLPEQEFEQIKKARGQRTIVLWEEPPLASIKQRLEGLGGVRCVVYSPVELRSAEAKKRGRDFMDLMRANAARLAKAAKSLAASPEGSSK